MNFFNAANHLMSPDQLRLQFPFLSFLTDIEIKNVLSMVETVSLATSIDPEAILDYMASVADQKAAWC